MKLQRTPSHLAWDQLPESENSRNGSRSESRRSGGLTLRNLAALADERGDRDEAAQLWKRVLDQCPGDRESIANGKPSFTE